jgi:serine/threonine protein kinase/Flp pilus assembly protein TadD
MPVEARSLKELFLSALAVAPAERAAWLERECGHDAQLRQRVELMLAAHDTPQSLLDRLAPAGESPQATTGVIAGREVHSSARLDDQKVGDLVAGRYKLLEQLGEGGMGTVWMAQQQEPVKRLVALKVIKPGMDSKQVLARFEAERQALAMMDHPHIARVLDAGTTATGRPFFVMELVKGVPLTKYCDAHRLTPKDRLELFIPVCQAIQHAHQKGIIHRDIKPSNVLVAQYDGKPVPKVIDFGVAKATGQQLTEHTLVTGFGAVVGTLEYMSPEQAELNQLDIDTRSDIYSLGVLLYELLTGSTPLQKKRLKEEAMLEVLRIIREEEPPKPSTRLSTTDELPSVAANRGLEPKKLGGLVRGELDWIVMKALEKDRNRRYETANGFAQDIQRYLADEPVLASPPSARYRFRKFARRNKTALAVAGLILFFIALLGGGGGWVVRDRAAREEAVAKERIDRQKRLTAQVETIFEEVDRLEREQKWPEAWEAVKRVEAALQGGEPDDALQRRVGNVVRDLAFAVRLDRIRQERATFAEGNFNYAGAARDYALAFRDYGVDLEALPPDEAVARLRAKPALAAALAAALDDWVAARGGLAEDEPGWKPLLMVVRGLDPDPLRDQFRAAFGQPVRPELQAELLRLAESIHVKAQAPATLIAMAQTLHHAQLADAGLRILRDGQYAYPADFWVNFTLGNRLYEREDYAEALRYCSIAVSIRPDSAAAHHNLGVALSNQGLLDEAIAELHKALRLDKDSYQVHTNLGVNLHLKRSLDEAIAAYSEAIRLNKDYPPAHNNLGCALAEKGRLDDAVAEWNEAIRLEKDFADPHYNLGKALYGKGMLDEAIDEYRKGILIKKDNARAHNNLGDALKDKGLLDEAIAEFGEAIRLKKDWAEAHCKLGAALYGKGLLDEAIEEYRKAILIQKDDAVAHSDLGCALTDKGLLDDAIAECEEAIRLKKDYAEAHCNLGLALMQKGQFRQSIEELRRGDELGSRNPRWPYPSAQWLRESQRLAQLDDRLSAVLEGKDQPKDASERLAFTELCQQHRKYYAAAARFFEQFFADNPVLADNLQAPHRYNAACAAALAGCGQGKDADKLDDSEKARLRGQALDWLKGDLALHAKQLTSGQPANRAEVQARLRYWLADADFAGVRGLEPLAELPEGERQSWQRLWNEVAEMLKQARDSEKK